MSVPSYMLNLMLVQEEGPQNLYVFILRGP